MGIELAADAASSRLTPTIAGAATVVEVGAVAVITGDVVMGAAVVALSSSRTRKNQAANAAATATRMTAATSIQRLRPRVGGPATGEVSEGGAAAGAESPLIAMRLPTHSGRSTHAVRCSHGARRPARRP